MHFQDLSSLWWLMGNNEKKIYWIQTDSLKNTNLWTNLNIGTLESREQFAHKLDITMAYKKVKYLIYCRSKIPHISMICTTVGALLNIKNESLTIKTEDWEAEMKQQGCFIETSKGTLKKMKQTWRKCLEIWDTVAGSAAEWDRDGSTGRSCHLEHGPAPQKWLYTSASEHRVHLKIGRKNRKAKDEKQQWTETNWKRERQEVNGCMKTKPSMKIIFYQEQ